MINCVMDNLAPISGSDEMFVLKNDKFVVDFPLWFEVYRQAANNPRLFLVVNDGSRDDANKLGAMDDPKLVLEYSDLDY
jgi:hypothetical protein